MISERRILAPKDFRRFREKIYTPWGLEGCWVWLAKINKYGYACFWLEGKEEKAARLCFEMYVGKLPNNMVADHLCKNRWCVNYSHLEPVTNRENIIRGGNKNREKTHCPKGHEYTEENTYIRITKQGWKTRQCKKCYWPSHKEIVL